MNNNQFHLISLMKCEHWNGSSTTNPTRRRQESFRNPSSERAREPIRKSPREFIIPITLEGGGCITPLTPMTPMTPTPMTPMTPMTPGTPMSGTPNEAEAVRPASANVRQKTNRTDRSRRHGLFHFNYLLFHHFIIHQVLINSFNEYEFWF